MAHAEIIQNGVVIVKPDPRLMRAIRLAQQFLGKLGKVIPGMRSLVRHEQMLHWLHRELRDFAARQAYRGKAVYIALDEKILSGVKEFGPLIRANAKLFIPIDDLENGIRNAFSIMAREKIHGEWKKKTRKQVQTYGEPWQHRSSTGRKKK